MSAIVSSAGPVTLLGGAPVSGAVLEAALALAPVVVAADGGADLALARGLRPAAVIGDMDSISQAARQAFADILHPIGEQMTTDFDKALRSVAAPATVAVGMMGGRLDHELGAMNVIARRADRACVVLGEESLAFACPPDLSLDLAPGSGVGLFPMAPVRIASEGLRWPTGGLDFAPAGLTGTSNEALGPVRLRPEAPGMLVILPAAALAVAVRALAAPGPRWSAPPDAPAR